MNILVPMAGAGVRLAKAGYNLPKPLVQVNGRSLIEIAYESWGLEGKYIFVVQESHDQQFDFQRILSNFVEDFTIIRTSGLTQGAACTALLAEEYVDNEEELVIAVVDVYNKIPKKPWSNVACDGVIFVTESQSPIFSYAKVDDESFVAEVAEKKVISKFATSGIYHWAHGCDFVKYAKQMISKNVRTNNEFYICPVYNEAIADGKKFVVVPVDEMYDLGTHENIQIFTEKFT